jgi:hypothetical protein
MIIFNLQFRLLILIWYILIPVQLQSIPVDWQSSANVSGSGFEFSPVDQSSLFLFEVTAKSIISCTATCQSATGCRIFDYDNQSHRCRMFQGDIATMGSIVASSSSQSRVGTIKLLPEYFVNWGQPCSYCLGSHFLVCINNSCRCPPDTFFNGSSCQSQKLLGADCNNSAECRTDLNYTCLPHMQCGRKCHLYTVCLDLINKVLNLHFLSMAVLLNSKFSM